MLLTRKIARVREYPYFIVKPTAACTLVRQYAGLTEVLFTMN